MVDANDGVCVFTRRGAILEANSRELDGGSAATLARRLTFVNTHFAAQDLADAGALDADRIAAVSLDLPHVVLAPRCPGGIHLRKRPRPVASLAGARRKDGCNAHATAHRTDRRQFARIGPRCGEELQARQTKLVLQLADAPVEAVELDHLGRPGVTPEDGRPLRQRIDPAA